MDGHEPQDAVAPARHGWRRRLAPPLSLVLALALVAGASSAFAHGATPRVEAAAAPTQVADAVQVRREAWGGGPLPAPADPYGALLGASAPYADRIVVYGWAADPSTGTSVRIDVAVDGVVRGGGQASWAVGGGSFAFDLTVQAPAGASTACAIARNAGPGIDVQLGCRDLRPPPLAGGYTWMSTEPRGHPIRFNPCLPVTIAYNPAGGPTWGRGELDAAVAELRGATGLDLRVVQTNEAMSFTRPVVDLLRYGATWSPVLVGYSSPDLISALLGGVAGLGGPSSAWGPDGRVAVTGIVVLDGPQVGGLPTGWGTGPTLAKLFAHELAHVLGLGHISDGNQLMNPSIPSRAGGLGPGDRTGLGYLGTGQPCRRMPALPVAAEVTAADEEVVVAPDGLPEVVQHLESD